MNSEKDGCAEGTVTWTAETAVGRAAGERAPDAGAHLARWVTALIIVAGLGAGAVLVVLAVNADITETSLRATLAVWTSVPYIVAGALAWRLRPESRMGFWMVVTGFVIAITFLNWSTNDVLFTIGTATQYAPPLMLLVVFLTYPSGRVSSTADQLVLVTAGLAASLTLLYMPLGWEGPRSVLALFDAPELRDSIHDVQSLLMVAALATGAVLLLVRRVRAGWPLRPWLGYLIDSFSVVLLMLAVLYLVQITGWGVVTEPIRLATFALIGVAPIVFLFGLMQERLGRASVAELVAFSTASPGPAELQDAVARALRDPSARILYWIPDFDTYADVDGKAADPLPGPGMAATAVTRDGAPVAMLLHDQALNNESALLDSVAATTGMLIQKAQLEVELRARVEELRGSRMRILEAEQRERRRLERDLHDGAQQRLLALSLALGEIEAQVGEDEDLRRRVETARAEVSTSLSELRDLAHGIHPAALIDHGLTVALEAMATRAPFPVDLRTGPLEGIPQRAELTTFYLVSEALANIAKHSRATSASIDVHADGEVLHVEISDDGVGGADTRGGTGLRGLADRVEAVGGTFRVWSPTGGGTTIKAEIPCAR